MEGRCSALVSPSPSTFRIRRPTRSTSSKSDRTPGLALNLPSSTATTSPVLLRTFLRPTILIPRTLITTTSSTSSGANLLLAALATSTSTKALARHRTTERQCRRRLLASSTAKGTDTIPTPTVPTALPTSWFAPSLATRPRPRRTRTRRRTARTRRRRTRDQSTTMASATPPTSTLPTTPRPSPSPLPPQRRSTVRVTRTPAAGQPARATSTR